MFEKIYANYKVPSVAQSICNQLATKAESTLNSKCEEKMGGSSGSSTTELIETESGVCDGMNSIATQLFNKLCSALDEKVSGAGTICTKVVEAAESKLNSVCEEKMGGSSSSTGGSSSSTASELIVAAGHTNGILREESTDSVLIESESGSASELMGGSSSSTASELNDLRLLGTWMASYPKDQATFRGGSL